MVGSADAVNLPKKMDGLLIAMNPIVIARARSGYHIFNPRRHYSDCDDRERSTAAAGIGSAG